VGELELTCVDGTIDVGPTRVHCRWRAAERAMAKALVAWYMGF
jgi:hypothetical protein